MPSKVYSFFSLGWKGTDNQWRHYTRAYLYLAALATPLVLSVHSVVSWDFAMSIIPGWHGTIFAPYFVAGAIYSGVGMVLTILIPLRKALKIEHMITDYHFDNLAKLTLQLRGILVLGAAADLPEAERAQGAEVAIGLPDPTAHLRDLQLAHSLVSPA